MQSDWPRSFSNATQELDFSQPCSFHRFPKATMVYHLKLKNQLKLKLKLNQLKLKKIDVTIFFSKSVLPIYFRSLWACLTKVKEKCMIKLKLP